MPMRLGWREATARRGGVAHIQIVLSFIERHYEDSQVTVVDIEISRSQTSGM